MNVLDWNDTLNVNPSLFFYQKSGKNGNNYEPELY